MSAQILRGSVQAFVRRFGLLAPDKTPCGQSLPPATAHALSWLLEEEEAGRAPNQSELAAVLGLDKSNVARLCARLEAAGHVVRDVDAEDRRVRRLRLGTKGRRMARRVDASSRERFERVFAAIPLADRRRVIEGLDALVSALDAIEEVAA